MNTDVRNSQAFQRDKAVKSIVSKNTCPGTAPNLLQS